MTTRLHNGQFTETNDTLFSSAFGSAGRDRNSIVARRNARIQRRIARSL